MFQLQGILKKEEIKEFSKKDGSVVKKRIVYIEPQDSIFPVAVNINDYDLKLGNIGDQISLDVAIYPFYFQDGKIKRADVSYYVPNKQVEDLEAVCDVGNAGQNGL